VDMGVANNHCRATHNYESQKKETLHAKNKIFDSPKLGHRKFAV